jgi:cellulose synthase/poly-beta-1,6-N-acetylglucosamine synthase-like glycosyltransferase
MPSDREAEPEHRPVWREWSAERRLAPRQRVVVAALGAAVAAGLVLVPGATLPIIVGALTLLFVGTTFLKAAYFVVGYRARSRSEASDAPPDASGREPSALPVYSVLIPLFREANVVPELLDSLERLSYPADLLEVLLLVEHDDPDTRSACERGLRPGWRVVEVPAGGPRTKPRALNVGLSHVTGQLLTIYDAEDRPEPDQLQKAVLAFDRHPENVACLQARLDFYNSGQNLLTKWFACEYATHYGLYLRGLAECGHPLPLGGTSCHFRTDVVRRLGGWDPWNVTEDCELGMRLAAAGLESRTLESVTWEEAMPRLRRWIRQRSRWVKGYAQTGAVMLRAPVRTAAAMGGLRYLAALATVAAVPLVLLSQVVFWAMLWLYVGLRTGGADVSFIEALFPEPLLSLAMLSLLAGNFAVLLAHVGAVYQQRRYELVRYAVVTPVYWLLASIAAWRGVLQLIWAPHFWDKTAHGLATEVTVPQAASSGDGRRSSDGATWSDGRSSVAGPTPEGHGVPRSTWK